MELRPGYPLQPGVQRAASGRMRAPRQTRCTWAAVVAVVLACVSCALHTTGAATTSFRVGVLAKRGEAQALAQWEPTFTDYLQATLPQYNFTTVPLPFIDIYEAVATRTVDFMFANPSFFACLEREYGVTAALTLLNEREGFALAKFSGVLFTLANRTDINTLEDLAEAIVEVVDYSSLGGFQMQWRAMDAIDLNPFIFPPQLRFAGIHDSVVFDVLSGSVDVGAVRTDTLERMQSEGLINMSHFKVINSVPPSPEFPFVRSTSLYPEWPFAVLPHVEAAVAGAVTKALLSLPAGSNATTAGKYAGWITPQSYLPVHSLFEEIGFLLPDGSCRRTDSLYDGLFCPSGYNKLPNDQFGQCNTTCPATYVCTCRACRKIVEAQLVVTPRVIVLGQAVNVSLALSLPSQPLRPVTVTLTVTMANAAPVSVVLGKTEVSFTTSNWDQALLVPVALVPHAVQFGNAEAGIFFAVASEDPDYHALSVLPSQVVVQWPLCSAADLVQSISDCDPASLKRSIVSAWREPLNGTNGAEPATCSGGLALPAPASVACAYVVLGSPLAITVNGITLLFVVLDLAAMVFIWLRRHVRRGIIQRSQPPFMLLIAGGALPAYAFIVSMTVPNSDFFCRVRPLLLSNTFAIVFGALVIKSYRVHRIVNNMDMTKRVRLTTPVMLSRLALLVLVNAGICVAWILFDPPTAHTVYNTHGLVEVPEVACSFGGTVFVVALLVFCLALATAGLVLAHKVRNAGKGFEESKYTGIAVFSIVTIALLVTPIYGIAQLDAVTSYLLICVAVELAVTGTLGLLLLPKIYNEYILMRKAAGPVSRTRNPIANVRLAGHGGSRSGGVSGSAAAGASGTATSTSEPEEEETELLAMRARLNHMERVLARAEAEKERLKAQARAREAAAAGGGGAGVDGEGVELQGLGNSRGRGNGARTGGARAMSVA